jgi:hypothetical protein
LDPTTNVFNECYAISLLNVQEFLVGLASWVEGIIKEAMRSNKTSCSAMLDSSLLWLVSHRFNSIPARCKQQSIRQSIRIATGSAARVGQDDDIQFLLQDVGYLFTYT